MTIYLPKENPSANPNRSTDGTSSELMSVLGVVMCGLVVAGLMIYRVLQH